MIETSSAIFGDLQIFSENVRKRSCGLRTTLRESVEIFGKSSKTSLLVCLCIVGILYNKKKITRSLGYEISLLMLKNISLVRWLTREIFFNTRREISYLRVAM